MTVHEALHFFAGQHRGGAAAARLFEEIGLGYLRLGQPATHALGRRGAARQAGRAPAAAAGPARALRPRRAHDRPAHGATSTSCWPASSACSRRARRSRDRAQHGRGQAGRLGHRPRARGRRRGRRSSCSRARPRRSPRHGRGHTARYLRAALDGAVAAAATRLTRVCYHAAGRGRPSAGSAIDRAGASDEPMCSLRAGGAGPRRLVRPAGAASDLVRGPGRQPQEPQRAARGRRPRRELGKSRRREAVAPLAALVRDPESKVRLEVVRALRELRDLSGVPALVTLLRRRRPDDPRGGHRRRWSRSTRSGTAPARSAASSRRSRTSTTAPRSPPYTAVDPSVFRGLAGALRDENADIRADAASPSASSAAAARCRDLVAALQDPAADGARPRRRPRSARCGDRRGRPGADPAAGRRITDGAQPRAPGDRRAARARGGPGAARDVRAEPPAGARHARAGGAEPHRRPGAGATCSASSCQDPDPERKRLAIEGLGRISDPSMLPAFKKDYQREKNDEVTLAYASRITLLGDRAFLDSLVLRLPSRTLGRARRGYILEMGPGILPDLYPYLSDPDAERARRALRHPGRARRPGRDRRSAPLLSDPSPDVADRANRAVERLRRGGARAGAARERESGRCGGAAAVACGGCARNGLVLGHRERSVAEARTALAERRYDDALARVGDADGPRGRLPAGARLGRQGGDRPAADAAAFAARGAPPAPRVQAGGGARARRSTSTRSRPGRTSSTRSSRSPSCWPRTRCAAAGTAAPAAGGAGPAVRHRAGPAASSACSAAYRHRRPDRPGRGPRLPRA